MRTGVIVIGGGRAGLAMGYHLARRGIDFVILDGAPRVSERSTPWSPASGSSTIRANTACA
jgi:cation diffusion facilitator CzcD-associated flavoprotein CzcO